MRRIVFSALFAALAIIATSSVTPVLAHDGDFTASSQGDKERDKDAKSEAGQLTDELKAAATRPAKLPAIQAAVAGQAERRRELIHRLADTSPAAVLELALTPSKRAALPASVRSAVEERVNLDGELQVLHHDFEDGHSAYETKLVKGGTETPVRFGASLGQAKPGDVVKTSGVALAGASTVVKNYGTVLTPAMHPYVDGTNPAGQTWRASTSQTGGGHDTAGPDGDVYLPAAAREPRLLDHDGHRERLHDPRLGGDPRQPDDLHVLHQAAVRKRAADPPADGVRLLRHLADGRRRRDRGRLLTARRLALV